MDGGYSAWDTESPVVLAGANGAFFETRPTPCLARELAEADAAYPTNAHKSRFGEERLLRVGGSPDVPEEPRGGRRRTVPADRPVVPSAATLPRPRQSCSMIRKPAYSPGKFLTDMGFDAESVKVALVAAGGDVDRALRILLEDGQAHAREESEWEFEGDAGWVPYDQATDEVLRDAASRGESTCAIRIEGRQYLLDFGSLTQFNLATNRTRRIRKRDQKLR